jgi:uncharacterized protein YycO
MKLQVALFKHPTGIVRRLIRWQTDSIYSHAALLFNDTWLFEADFDGVAESRITDFRNVDVFDAENITEEQKAVIYEFAKSQEGKKYDWWGVLRFISRDKLPENDRWFCSELVFAAFKAAEIELLERVEPWQVSPGMLARSPILTPIG